MQVTRLFLAVHFRVQSKALRNRLGFGQPCRAGRSVRRFNLACYGSIVVSGATSDAGTSGLHALRGGEESRWLGIKACGERRMCMAVLQAAEGKVTVKGF